KCTTDACASVTCDAPPKPRCTDATTRTSFAAMGECDDGICHYEQMDEACDGDDKCLEVGGNLTCVACLSNQNCGGTKPVCNLATHTCRAQPSCAGLAKSCGPNQDADCCASSVVPGGSFNRLNDSEHPATISDFRLDKYEVTVGRFRKFFAEIGKFELPEGAGKNINNADDPGWDASGNQQFSRELGYIEEQQLNCRNDASTKPTWTHDAGTSTEARPINCVGWKAAQAFCIWDGGRLPTDAEWNYAAAGGDKNRDYPWGSDVPDCDLANYRACLSGSSGAVAPVGSTPLGDGLYGQSDLAGNLYEWVQDYWDQDKLPATCRDCATLKTDVVGRVARGGSYALPDTKLSNSVRLGLDETTYRDDLGFRCAYAK
ncbi:MAG TPA: SUMF1/EgtB/PvdO family nonheme iron enzyme, partial [Polyangiaceae bacterium]|nr:SUMF1/EgtB/PvdO family nonheme iron enzyme [Polyangiaceae bacterium]